LPLLPEPCGTLTLTNDRKVNAMTKENSGDVIPHFLRAWALNLGLVCLGCVLALVVLEIGLRLFWRPELASWQRSLDTIVPLDPEVTTGVAGPAHIVTNSEGIRGAEWANDRSREYRILAVGSSNTECLLQDQPNTWPALLQTRLPTTADGRSVWVGNTGSAGHTSRHIVLAMRYMLDQYHPDAVIILAGGNDSTRILNDGAAYDPDFIDNDAKMRDLAWDFAERPVSLVDSGNISVRNTYLWLFLREFYHRFFGASARGMVQNMAAIREQQANWRQARLIVDEIPDLQAGLAGYRRNLLEMIRLAQKHRVHIVFMTMPGLYKPDMTPEEMGRLWVGGFGEPSLRTYWSPRVRGAGVDALNRVLLETCSDQGVDCIDLASMLPKSTVIFWDQGHFTDEGSRRVADALVGYFQAYFAKTQR
jgi:lysophospholipase L1-like esterase